jgi:catechol 2,3-dioxygenase
VLHEEPGARPAGRHAGLYHFALLSDSREELAHAVLRLAATRTPIEGASDHGVSEAIYLSDPDRNGIELYADRPREEWPPPDQPDARVGMFTIALDVQGLLSAAEGDPRPLAGPGLQVGHVHLHVNDIAAGLAFHRDVVGFERMVSLGSAEFLAAGGYHHHLGINTWRGESIPAAPPSGVAGLRNWTIELPPADLEKVRARLQEAGSAIGDRESGFLTRDPSGTAVAFNGRGPT